MRQIFCFGNQFIQGDEVAHEIGKLIKSGNFKIINANSPNEVLNARDDIIILDVAKGIDDVSLINNIDNLQLINSITCHDMDLAFHLKLMKTTGQINKINIIAIPYGTKKEQYNSIKTKVEKILKNI